MQEFKNSDVVYEDAVIKFHHFHGARSKGPVLVNPPHAGRHGDVTQNLIDRLRLAGSDTYAAELKSATSRTANTSVSDLVNNIYNCIDIIGNPVDLLGVCQGGWVSTIATAQRQDLVKRLALFAAPINTQTGENNGIEEYCANINMTYHKEIVRLHGGVQPGYMQWLSFAVANPVPVFMGRWVKLYNLCVEQDTVGIKKWVSNNGWYDSPQDLAGAWFLDALENHFAKNKLFKGEWVINGKTVNLADITCDIFVYSGEDDDITHPEQSRTILDVVSSKHKSYTCFEEAGHTYVFTGEECVDKALTDMGLV